MPVDFGTVRGRFTTFVMDGNDPVNDPDLVPLAGTVKFTLNVPKLVQVGATPAPLVIASTPFVAVLDAEGYLSTPDSVGAASYPVVNLVANDDTDLNPYNTTYSVEYSLRLGTTPIPLASHTIFVPSGGSVDLANFIPPSSAPAIGTAQAEALLALAVRTINGVGPDSAGNVVVSGGGGGGGSVNWVDIVGTPSTFAPIIGSGPTQAVAGNDARLTDQRTPLDGSVTSTKIADGAIVDADINASANIAQSKVSGLTSALAALAPLNSPIFTGDARAVTPATSDNDTSIATTAFVKAAIASLISGSPVLLDTLDEIAAAIGDDPNFATTMTTALGLRAMIDSPSFTGNPTAPTPATGDNDTSIATTAFVKAQGYATTASLSAYATTAALAGYVAKVIALSNPATDYVSYVNIQDDGSSTTTWVDRLRFTFTPQTGDPRPTWWNNEYGEGRGMPAKDNTVGLRLFAGLNSTTFGSRDAAVPVFEVVNQRDGTRTTMFGILKQGDIVQQGFLTGTNRVFEASDTVDTAFCIANKVVRGSIVWKKVA